MKISPIILLVTSLTVANAKKGELRDGKEKKKPDDEPEPGLDERPEPLVPEGEEEVAAVTDISVQWSEVPSKLKMQRYDDKCVAFNGYYNGSYAKLKPCADAPNFEYDKITQRLKISGTSYCLDAWQEQPQAWYCGSYTEQKWAGVRVPYSNPARWALFNLHYEYTLDDWGSEDVSVEWQADGWFDLATSKQFVGLGEDFFD